MDRDAILDGLQDQIDDLTSAVHGLHRLLDAHAAIIIELARLAGLGDQPAIRPAPARRPGPADG
jgi:hypothetical protein